MKPLLSILLLLACLSADAATYKVSVQGNGAQTNSFSWFATNSFQPGDNIYLETINNTNLPALNYSGTASQPISLIFDTGSGFSSPTLQNTTYWITLSGQSNIVVNGQGATIACTSNGTLAANGGSMPYDNSLAGIVAYGCQNITIENLNIRNIYQRQTNTEAAPAQGFGSDIACSGSGITVSNCTIGEAANGFYYLYGTPGNSNITLIRNTFTNHVWDIAIAAGSTTNAATITNITIISNAIHLGDMYETGGCVTGGGGTDLGLHRDGIIFFNYATNFTGYQANTTIAYNSFSSGQNPLSQCAGSAAIFFDGPQVFTQCSNVVIYNNLSTLPYPLSWSGGGGMLMGSGTNVLIANNTCVAWFANGNYGGGGGITLVGNNARCYNNYIANYNPFGYSAYIWNTGGTNDAWANTLPGFIYNMSTAYSDWNVYNFVSGNFDAFTVSTFDITNIGTALQISTANDWADWTNLWITTVGSTNFDLHSSTNSPLWASTNTWVPATNDTVMHGQGVNLTAYGITNDYFGNPRPTTGAWDIGYAVASASPPPPIPAVLNLTLSPTGSINATLSTNGQINAVVQ